MRSDRVLGRLRTITAGEPLLAPAAPRGAQLQLRRAWPRSGGGLTLEYEHADGIVAGQWFADADYADDLSRRLGADAVVVEASGETVVLQTHGADRRLPALAGLLAAPGARLVSHRAERRATVAKPGAFVKVVPPGRAAALADAHRCASELAPDVVIPRVLATDDRAGTFELEPLHGVALHDLLAEGGGLDHVCAAGAALARFHSGPLDRGSSPHRPLSLAHHGPGEEAAVIAAWLDRVRPFDARLHAVAAPAAGAVIEALAALEPAPPALLHRDLHDKQIFITPKGVGFIDLDTCVAGDAAVDVANLLAHLRLRAWQAGHDGDAAAACEALLEGYGAGADLRARLGVYEQATLLRLACVYAFRPRWDDALPHLLLEAAARPSVVE